MEIDQKDIYSIKFCSSLLLYKRYFAAVGTNLATIYRIGEVMGQVELVQVYRDSDTGENYHALTWADKGDGYPLLVLGGKRGILKVVNTITLKVEVAFIGHGHEILDITTHPVDTNLIISASRDESIRLWNIKKDICVAMFAGEKGHRSHVLSVSVHPCGNVLASSGMDNSIKIWNLVSSEVQAAISNSYTHDETASNIGFVTLNDQFPIFSTDKVHNNYVDCVRWVGDLLLSKSLCNRVALWTPDPLRAKDAVCILREFRLTHSNSWFFKMSTCDLLYIFAVGNYQGRVELFHITPPNENEQIKIATKSLLNGLEKSRESTLLDERFETGIESKPSATLYLEGGVPSDIRDSDFSIHGEYFVYISSSSVNKKSKIVIWGIENA